MRRRVMRVGMWVALVVSVLLGGALAVSWVRPSWIGRGGMVVGVTSGRLEFARSTGTLTRQGIAWELGSPQGYAWILVAPESSWRPSTAAARVSRGTPRSAMTLRVECVPLWPWLVLSVGATGMIWWRAGKREKPGHCRECGYDLAGLAGEKCPECGTLVAGSIARLIGAILGSGRVRRAAAGRSRLPAPC